MFTKGLSRKQQKEARASSQWDILLYVTTNSIEIHVEIWTPLSCYLKVKKGKLT